MWNKEIVEAAARNNANWCAAVCRSHGIGSRSTRNAWLCDGDPPPYYPRLVSLTNDRNDLQHAMLAHRRQGSHDDWGAKDSFGVLDEGAVWSRLFEAVWYARPPGSHPGETGRASVAGTSAALERWVEAWGQTPPGRPVFVPGILSEPGVSFLHDGAFLGGLVAYRSPEVGDIIGVSNFFGQAEARNGCLAWLTQTNPGCTIVGYGPEDDVASVSRLGFKTVGPLTVWLVRALD